VVVPVVVAAALLTPLSPGGSSRGDSPKEVEVLEVKLDPVGDSVTSGTATFRERGDVLYLELEASGLPKDGVVYFGEIHEGVCKRGQQGRDAGAEYAEVARPDSVSVGFDLLSANSPEYAHSGTHADADVLLGGVCRG
jgi:hypothetical protein